MTIITLIPQNKDIMQGGAVDGLLVDNPDNPDNPNIPYTVMSLATAVTLIDCNKPY